MPEWMDVCPLEKLISGNFRVVDLDDIDVMVFNIEGDFFALQDMCPHDGGCLSDDDVEGNEIICPRHGARFDIRDGAVTAPPANEDLHTFPVRLNNNMIQVRDDRDD